MRNLIILFILSICTFSMAQKRLKEVVFSEKLDKDIEILIELPKSYQTETKRNYPWILLLDGDYFLDVFSGNLSFGNYWDLYPECILFGINHLDGLEERKRNFEFNEDSGILTENAIGFYDFLRLELLPLLSKNFRLINFSVIAGYDYSAGFLNTFLMIEPNLFNGYLVISPEMHHSKPILIAESLIKNTKKNVYYYIATSTTDDKDIKNNSIILNNLIENHKENILKKSSHLNNEPISINNTHLLNENIVKPRTILPATLENFKFSFNMFEGYSHYATISVSIPSSLNFLFNMYKPIDQYEYDHYIKNLTDNQTQYLIDKYDLIFNSFGFKLPVRISDIKIFEDDITRKKNYDEFMALATFCKKEFPKTLLEKYFMGLYYENKNDMMNALKSYKSAYSKEAYGSYNKDLIFDKIESLRK